MAETPNTLDPLAVAEFQALRATIRERGTARIAVTAVTFMAWAACFLWSGAGTGLPAVALAPLVVLVAGFESVFKLHVGVERIGRYLAARYEIAGGNGPGWETTVGALASHAESRTPGIDPLSSAIFVGAMLVNLLPAATLAMAGNPMPSGLAAELALLAAAHVWAIARIFRAGRFARDQRRADTAVFAAVLGRLGIPRIQPIGVKDSSIGSQSDTEGGRSGGMNEGHEESGGKRG